MTEQTMEENGLKDGTRDLSGYTWREVIDELDISPNTFLHRFSVEEEMLQDKGYSRWIKDGKHNYQGYIIFDRDFITSKLAKMLLNLGKLSRKQQDDLIKEARNKIEQERKREEEENLEHLRQLIEQTGVTEEQLKQFISG